MWRWGSVPATGPVLATAKVGDMNIIQTLEAEQAARLSEKRPVPEFQPGDTVIVNVKVVEGDRSRVQAYEGVVIARNGGGLNESFTVRKISYGEGVERVFPIHSPLIDSIKLVRRARCAARSSIICATVAARPPASPSAPIVRREEGTRGRCGCRRRETRRRVNVTLPPGWEVSSNLTPPVSAAFLFVGASRARHLEPDPVDVLWSLIRPG